MRKTIVIILAGIMFVLAGCGANPPAEAAVEERTYPGSDEVADRLEEAGYYVEQYDEFEELGIAASRVKAAAGDDYLDMCFDVASVEDINTVMAFYSENYPRSNIMSDTDVVYCYSTDSVLVTVGLQETE